MSYGSLYLDNVFLTNGVLSRRCLAWIIDVVLIGVLVWVLWWVVALFGLVTLGLGFTAMAILPVIPFCYHFLSLMGHTSATPGQQMLGLIVRRNDDLGPPTMLQALVSVLCYYVTLATSGLLLVVALFTTRRRTLHDLVSGLVVVRTAALEMLTVPQGNWNMDGGSPYR